MVLVLLFPPVPSPAPPRAGCRAVPRACSRIRIRDRRERIFRHAGRHPRSHPLRSPVCRNRRSHGGQPVIRYLLDADLPRSATLALRSHGCQAADIRDLGLGNASDDTISTATQLLMATCSSLATRASQVFCGSHPERTRESSSSVFPRIHPLARNLVS